MVAEFRDLSFEDYKEISSILDKQVTNSFSGVFGSYFLWSDEHRTKICVENDILCIKYDLDIPKYEMPKGSGTDSELRAALEIIFEDAYNSGCKLGANFTILLTDEAEKLEEIFPNRFIVTAERDDFEYVYLSNDLASLRGKRYHSKRNHISKFTKKHEWKYKNIDISQKDKYCAFFDEWARSKSNVNPNELLAIRKALEFYEELNLVGGAIVIGDKIVACTIGERVNDDTFVVHFEKALPEFGEAYAVINNQFSKKIVENGYKFINREEDLGLPGLRKAKLSYHPHTLVEKYSAVVKKD